MSGSLEAAPTRLDELETPRLLLDVSRMEANIGRLRAHLAGRHVGLRPHVKTAKCIEIAHRLVEGQPGGITVSTLQEADAFAAAGFRDILYAVAIAPNAMRHAARLVRDGIELKVILDAPEIARALAVVGQREGVRFEVLIEVDCDGHRSGVMPEGEALVSLARLIAETPALRFCGLMTHAGASYQSHDVAQIEAAAEAERACLAGCARRLGGAGLHCRIVSVGSTPTALFGRAFDSITEVRAGVFVFNDLMMVNLGVATCEQIAISTLTSVIGHRSEHGWVITDSGWTALSSDQGTASQHRNYHFGQVCDLEGNPIEGVCVSAVNQEHGIVARIDGAPLVRKEYPLGRLLRVLPIHACATAANYAGYDLVRGSTLIGRWPRIAGR